MTRPYHNTLNPTKQETHSKSRQHATQKSAELNPAENIGYTLTPLVRLQHRNISAERVHNRAWHEEDYQKGDHGEQERIDRARHSQLHNERTRYHTSDPVSERDNKQRPKVEN